MQQLIDNDFDRLAAAVRAIGIGVVMIDGCTLVGKTTLSRALAERLRGVSIDTDDFIERRRGVFVEALRTGELKAAVDAALTLPKIVFVSGVCAREIADRAALNPVLFVYVQRNTTAGVEGDKDILDAEDGALADGLSPLDTEIADYHRRRQPRRKADIVYVRVAD